MMVKSFESYLGDDNNGLLPVEAMCEVCRCRVKEEHIRQSRPDSDRGLSHFQYESLCDHSSCSLRSAVVSQTSQVDQAEILAWPVSRRIWRHCVRE